MATITLKDLRRTDQRSTVEPGPVWVTSGWITYEYTNKGALLFSFPAAKVPGTVVVHSCLTEISEDFAGGTPTIDIGQGTIATDEVYDGDNITIVDADEFEPNADITASNAGIYPSLTGDLVTASAAGLLKTITPADTTVPVVYATLSASMTAGKARVHMLISEVPTA